MSSLQAIKQKHSVAYQVRWNGAKSGQTKFFSAKQYGSEAKAHKAAQAFLKKIQPKFPTIPKSTTRLRSNNLSGINALRLIWREMPGTGNIYGYIVVIYFDKKKKEARNRNYSIYRNGLEGAIEKALKIRKKHGFIVPSIEQCVNVFLPQLK